MQNFIHPTGKKETCSLRGAFEYYERLNLPLIPNKCEIKRHSKVDIRRSGHHSTIHTEKSNKMQQYFKFLLFHIYMRFNVFRATHRPSSEA